MLRFTLAAAVLGRCLSAYSSRHDSGGFEGAAGWPSEVAGPPPPPCRAGLCAGAPGRFPTAPGIVFSSEYNIPKIPSAYGPKTQLTDYLYFNIVFDSAEAQALGGHFNQFVPQLMLGSCLTNSTGPPRYNPIFTRVNSWKIGAQYFFALVNHSSQSNWTGHAATGKLIDVKPGDKVFTKFELSAKHVWTLSMGLVGSAPDTHSVVEATAPFMGLAPKMPTWDSPLFNTTRAGVCWEVYNVKNAGDFPSDGMNMSVTTKDTDAEGKPVSWFKPWTIGEAPTCSFSPKYKLKTTKTSDEQTMTLNISFATPLK